MDAKPLRLNINSNATLVTHHTPVPVPGYCQKEVEAGLDRYVWAGVIELAPICEPGKSHKTVICTKKDASPDEQQTSKLLIPMQLGKPITPEPTFYQARSIPTNKKKTVFNCLNGYHTIPLLPPYQFHHTIEMLLLWSCIRGLHLLRGWLHL